MTRRRSRWAWLPQCVVAGLAALGAPTAIAAGPTAIGVDSAGTSYAGFASGAVVRYRLEDGLRLGSWQTPVADVRRSLGGVMAVDVAPGAGLTNGGNVWVLDTNRRLQEFSRDGAFIRGFRLGACDGGNVPVPGTEGGLDVSNDSIYVAHPCADRVLRYRLEELPASGSTALAPVASAFVYAPHGVSVQVSEAAPMRSQLVYVAQPLAFQVKRLTPATLSDEGAQGLHSSRPADVFVNEHGSLYVSELRNDPGQDDRIYKYDADGNELHWIGNTGSEVGRLADPLAFEIATPPENLENAFVADSGNERVQRMTTDETGFTFWASAAGDPGAPPGSPGTGGSGSGDGERVRVVIEGGKAYARTARVDVAIERAPDASAVELSNDPDFVDSKLRKPEADGVYRWKLSREEPLERSRTVYVRFREAADDDTYRDHIKLDEGRPRLKKAVLRRRSSAGRAGKSWVLNVRAGDELSGLAELRTSRSRRGNYRVRPFRRRSKVGKASRARFVRVADRAGNLSKAKRVTRRAGRAQRP